MNFQYLDPPSTCMIFNKFGDFQINFEFWSLLQVLTLTVHNLSSRKKFSKLFFSEEKSYFYIDENIILHITVYNILNQNLTWYRLDHSKL